MNKLELSLEGDINVTAVWGVGDLSEDKPLGFTAVRVNIDIEADADAATLNEIIAHANRWSPVANTLRNAVSVSVS